MFGLISISISFRLFKNGCLLVPKKVRKGSTGLACVLQSPHAALVSCYQMHEVEDGCCNAMLSSGKSVALCHRASKKWPAPAGKQQNMPRAPPVVGSPPTAILTLLGDGAAPLPEGRLVSKTNPGKWCFCLHFVTPRHLPLDIPFFSGFVYFRRCVQASRYCAFHFSILDLFILSRSVYLCHFLIFDRSQHVFLGTILYFVIFAYLAPLFVTMFRTRWWR